MKYKINSIFKEAKYDYLILSASTVICAFISFFYSMFVKKYVEPLDYGIFSTCLLLQTYLNYGQLGVFNAYNRDYPQLIGAQKNKEAQELLNTSITYMWIVFCVLGTVIGIGCQGLYVVGKMEFKYFVGYILVILLVLIDNTASFSMYTARMKGFYNYSAVVGFVKTGVAAVLGLVAVKVIGYYGLFVMPIASALIAIILYCKKSFANFKLKVSKVVLVNAIKTGIPLMVNSLVWTLMASVDKFVILFFMDTYQLGVYSVPLMGFNTMVLIPQTISQVFYNKISIVYGQTNDKNTLLNECNKYTGVLTVITSLVAVGAFYVLPVFVQIVMPMYTEGIEASQILIIGVAIYSTTMLYGNVFSVLKWNRDLLSNSIILCILNIIFSTSMVAIMGQDIIFVATGTALSYVIYSVVLLIKISKRFEYDLKKLLNVSWIPMICIITPCILFYIFIESIFLAMGLSVIIVLIEIIIMYIGRRIKC